MKNDEKYNTLTKFIKKCTCGHSIIINNKRGCTICKWCGKLVFANKRLEMKYRQREIVTKLKKDLEDKNEDI